MDRHKRQENVNTASLKSGPCSAYTHAHCSMNHKIFLKPHDSITNTINLCSRTFNLFSFFPCSLKTASKIWKPRGYRSVFILRNSHNHVKQGLQAPATCKNSLYLAIDVTTRKTTVSLSWVRIRILIGHRANVSDTICFRVILSPFFWKLQIT